MEPQLLVVGAMGALVMGITLGVFGAGGSILTVPILVYLLHYPPVLAAHYSLIIVGIVSAFGVFWQRNEGQVKWKKIAGFAVPALTGMFFIKRVILPALPDVIQFSAYSFTLNQATLAVFSILMISAATSMIFLPVKDSKNSASNAHKSLLLLGIVGIAVGIVTGFVGAGGGFLIVPALIFLAGVSVKEATRASLFLIAINSIFGFLVGTRNWGSIPFGSLFLLVSLALFGIVSGLWLQKRIAASKLKPGFGFFVLAMGVYVLFTSII